MKLKGLLILLCMVFASLILPSCNDDTTREISTEEIIGKWQITNSYIPAYYTFKENKNIEIMVGYKAIEYGSYLLDGNKLSYQIGERSQGPYSIKLTEKEMTLSKVGEETLVLVRSEEM